MRKNEGREVREFSLNQPKLRYVQANSRVLLRTEANVLPCFRNTQVATTSGIMSGDKSASTGRFDITSEHSYNCRLSGSCS